MSVQAAARRAPARAHPALRAALNAARDRAFLLQALVLSRLLVVAAGAVGAVRLVPHISRSAVAANVHQLGVLVYLLNAPVNRFDSTWYLGIATHGYGSISSPRLAFYPVYPLLMRAAAVIVGSPIVAGVGISLVAFGAAALMLHRLTEMELGRPAADATVLLLAFAPLSFFFSAVYTESLFLALTVGAFLAARTGHWRLACALAAVASVTRVTGMALVPALALLRIRQTGRRGPELLWLAVAPLAFAAYAGALAASGYPPLAMFGAEGQWGRIFTGPGGGVLLGLLAAGVGAVQILRGLPVIRFSADQALAPPAQNIVLMVVLGVALRALAACRRRLGPAYALYAALALGICLSNPQAGAPLSSIDRYVLTIFPLAMVAGRWVAERRLTPLAVAVGSLLLVFYTAQVSAYAFVA